MEERSPRRPRILLGVTGSVAAVKAPEIAIRLVRELNAHVRVLLSAGGSNFWKKAEEYHKEYWDLCQDFINGAQPSDSPNTSIKEALIQLYAPKEEWKGWNRLGDPVLHIDLRDWADIFLIAPLSAHTLAKLAQGFCDDTLSCVARAWDFGYHSMRPAKPLVLAPAMNTAMWQHPLTFQHLQTIQDFVSVESRQNGEKSVIRVIEPTSKVLACGEVGMGALASVDCIVAEIADVLATSLL
ncbi:phosphopantothenoylcysteine decarboxylase [Fistulifera solaris]|uniref:Phosphopantothenoylcysteine decarboxylase n=1 Tax=Fistulifera solaris TaxID=1519565 RepID=A0A1Z5K1L6_FISSO|nr:phosphopantothenoylcysteine decarboxylase [Fistulifera solaris]|eukprot:GAX19908.1 phosphopantothenoylcysteine decarboxylase [Fistulifera solaris]